MSSENDSDPIASAAEGAAKAILKTSITEAQKIAKGLYERFKNRDIDFIQDKETIIIAKEQYNTEELKIFKTYINDKYLHILFQMGLTLRRLEKDKKPLESLNEKIRNKYDMSGLHIAFFVQNGLFSKLIGNILDRSTTSQRITTEIDNLLKNIDRTVAFIKGDDKVTLKTDEILTKIRSFSPETFIISSSKSAMKICKKIKERVVNKISNYDCGLYETENKRIYFLNRIEEIT